MMKESIDIRPTIDGENDGEIQVKEGNGVTHVIVVTRSAFDNAILVFVDTAKEPDGSDGGTPVRVLVNDGQVYP